MFGLTKDEVEFLIETTLHNKNKKLLMEIQDLKTELHEIHRLLYKESFILLNYKGEKEHMVGLKFEVHKLKKIVAEVTDYIYEEKK